jgi:pimeloyl-ACP methyl ester carboxylesterase
VDRLALALEFIPGQALRSRIYRSGLPPEFFTALEGICRGLRARGVTHLDLSSPTNVLATASGGPALIDLGGAVAVPLPRALVAYLERRALRKLRRSFEGFTPPVTSPAGVERGVDWELDLGAVRFGLRECGPLSDPVPVLLIPDAGHSAAFFAPVLARASAFERRVIAVDPPGFGRSRVARGRQSPRRVARQVAALATALRAERVDVVGFGWGGLVARALAAGFPQLVRVGLTLDTPDSRLSGTFLARWRTARERPGAVRDRLLREIPTELDPTARAELEAALLVTPPRRLRRLYAGLYVLDASADSPVLTEIDEPEQPWLDVSTEGDWATPLAQPVLIFEALAELSA